MLEKKLQDALANARIAAQDTYLVHLTNAVAAIDARQAAEPELQAYASALDALLDDSSFGVNPHLTNKFAQILGEAHFWLMCLDKGLRLTSPKSRTRKRQTFQLQSAASPFTLK